MRPVPDEKAVRDHMEAQALSIALACLENPGLSTRAIAEQVFGLVDTDNVDAEEARDGGETIRTINRRLAMAMDWGWIRRTGATKSTKYYVTDEFRHEMAMRHIAKPLYKRPKVGYQIEVLEEYKPNVTYYLDKQMRDFLHERCRPGTFNSRDPAQAQLMRRFLVDVSFYNALLEGVRANYVDTVKLLEENIRANALSEKDATILRNLHNAARLLVMATGYPSDPRDFRVCANDICQIHAIISDGLLSDRREQGRLRTTPIAIGQSQYTPLSVPDQIQSAFNLLVEKASAIKDPYEQAFFLSAHIPYLQPFVDCNKRTARIVCNIPLLNSGVLPISWQEVDLRSYNDALICLYEKQSFLGMALIFEEAYVRSVERFRQSQQERTPNRLEVVYAREIANIIRSRVFDGDDEFRAGVPDEHWAYVKGYVDSVLSSALENDMVLIPYRISHDEWRVWRDRMMSAEKAEDDVERDSACA